MSYDVGFFFAEVSNNGSDIANQIAHRVARLILGLIAEVVAALVYRHHLEIVL